jgi:hypothetical protein
MTISLENLGKTVPFLFNDEHYLSVIKRHGRREAIKKLRKMVDGATTARKDQCRLAGGRTENPRKVGSGVFFNSV